MRNIRIVFSYDGGLFYGSQAQSKVRTVQGQLERALHELTGDKVRIEIAGRTDRGVHALSQAANFLTRSAIPVKRFPAAINSRIGKGIIVKSAKEVASAFNSRRSAKSREYFYLIFNGPTAPVMFWERALHVAGQLNIAKMRRASRYLVGRHNFVNLCAKGGQKDNNRRIDKIEIGMIGKDLIRRSRTQGSLIFVRIVAGSFLYKMVRSIVGVLLDVGRGRIKAETVKEMVKGKPIRERSAVVPPCGLYLSEVKY